MGLFLIISGVIKGDGKFYYLKTVINCTRQQFDIICISGGFQLGYNGLQYLTSKQLDTGLGVLNLKME